MCVSEDGEEWRKDEKREREERMKKRKDIYIDER